MTPNVFSVVVSFDLMHGWPDAVIDAYRPDLADLTYLG